MALYHLMSPIAAIYDKPGGGYIRVTIQAGAILKDSPQDPPTLLGLVGVSWKSRQYSVSLNDLINNSERASTASQ